MRVLDLYFACFGTLWLGYWLGCLIIAWWGWQSRLPIWTLLAWMRVGNSVGFFFLCSLARVEHLLSEFSVLLGCPFHGPLHRESRLLLETFFGLWLLTFLGSQLLQFHIWVMCGKRTQETQHHAVPSISWSMAILSSSLYLLVFLPLFYIYCLGFLVVLRGKNREKHIYSIFLEVKVFTLVLNSIMSKSHSLFLISKWK